MISSNRRQLVRRIGRADGKAIGVGTRLGDGSLGIFVELKTEWSVFPAGGLVCWASGNYLPVRTDPRRYK